MHFPITIMSDYAAKILDSNVSGSVHSIYRKTVNLQFGSCLLSLQTTGSPLSPVSLITPLNQADMEALKFEAGQPVVAEQNSIVLSGPESSYSFSFADTRIITLELRHPFPQVQKALIAEALRRSRIRGFGNQELILSAARLRTANCAQYFRQGSYKMAAQELALLLGLGIGLTPSGDDFLCGVLAGLNFTGNHWHPFSRALQSTLRAHLSDTNDISRTFLSCALHSYFSYAVITLPQAASPEEILTAFEAIGHSSGIDTLCGIYYGISLFS
ncbi:DUF2877 domain-containing protein [Bariatricus massiliensis]|uniref:DUF2877 domain-containing protein n=1 Tax=Bariatricus massiliensis TaxID=1745713 RepID=A0ABS8DLU1_9FIRM|nr:DUF2877 domain-containing protein [Bariatricus massiliensis]MCB7305991.1 DUF2877 domain-containing protein [Bariatricus massiliensis]MCB7374683.1 DUF2877 domain-containing protein [Bariatricus massiliensis]MCB7389134.1 DUF2877 domain-containing protein [Bariatricus massiliensis]MCB7413307.1 DUF2877 domain-containing protein [Bariatricus massiliensis]